MSREGKGFVGRVLETRRRSPGLFYLAAASAVFIVLYLATTLTVGKKLSVPAGEKAAADYVEAMKAKKRGASGD